MAIAKEKLDWKFLHKNVSNLCLRQYQPVGIFLKLMQSKRELQIKKYKSILFVGLL